MPQRTLSTFCSTVGRELGRLVLVSRCVVCREDLPWKERVRSCCASCWAEMQPIGSSRCSRCSLVQGGEEGIGAFVCGECREAPPACEWIEAWGQYRGGLEQVLQAFKFQRHDFLGAPLGGLLVQALERREECSFDVVTAVPLHSRKLRRRGYNQSELLARRLASLTGMAFDGSLLRRTIPGKPQSTLPRQERQKNVRRAFAAGRSPVNGRSVLLVDDVCTTGATLEACARVLLAAGAARVCAVVVARA